MRLRHMIVKEFRQFRRNPVLLRMAIVMPLLQTLLLSFAANLEVIDVPLAVWDESRSAESRALVQQVIASGYFVFAGEADGDALQESLDRGTALLALHIPPDFAAELARGEATVQLLVDGSESNIVMVAAGYLSNIATAYAASSARDSAAARGIRVELPEVVAAPRVFYNPDLRSLWFMAPAVLAMVLTVLMQNLTALSIARERELGTLEQLVMTPLRSAELLLGKLAPYGLIGALDAAVITGIVVLIFGVPLRGSLLVLGAATLIFLFATLGLGLLISTIAQNQQQAQLINFFLTFPAILLSGFMFRIENLPGWLRPLSNVVPMTWYLQVIRGVFLRGSGFPVLWPQLLALLGLAALFFAVGAARFRKRLD